MQNCLICDDHPLVRRGLAFAVDQRWPGIRILEAGSYPEALSLLPDVDAVLLDLGMPGAPPRDGVAAIKAATPAPILIVTASTDDDLMLDLLDLGIGGIVTKDASVEIVVAALALLIAGGRHLPPSIAELAARGRDSRRGRASVVAAQLSPRQRDVIQLIGKGYSNKEIAQAIGVAPTTVKTHVAQALAIIGAENRTDGAVKAAALGLLSAP